MWLFGIALGVMIGIALVMLLGFLGKDFPFLLWQAMDRKRKPEEDVAPRVHKAGAS
jgi:hypothetical protein